MKPSRRGFLGSVGVGAAGLAGAAGIAQAQLAPSRPQAATADAEPFYGPHQAGITTPMQEQLYFASFDLAAKTRQDVVGLLRAWTEAAARLTAGLPASQAAPDPEKPPADSGEAAGLNPSRLTLTFGFGPDFFSLNGEDRYGIAARRPAALVDLQHFPGDELVAGQCGGALCVQACADAAQGLAAKAIGDALLCSVLYNARGRSDPEPPACWSPPNSNRWRLRPPRMATWSSAPETPPPRTASTWRPRLPEPIPPTFSMPKATCIGVPSASPAAAWL